MEAILARVRQVLGRSPEEGNRVVIFSSFTSYLDLLVRAFGVVVWLSGRFDRAEPP